MLLCLCFIFKKVIKFIQFQNAGTSDISHNTNKICNVIENFNSLDDFKVSIKKILPLSSESQK